MDEASAELLRHLAGQVSRKPWLICATRRPVEGGFSAADGVPPIPAMTIQLQPLDAEAAQQLVAQAAAEGLLQHEVTAITDRAGGNPLFLQELVASSRAPEEEALPESVEAVVATRIDRLQPGDRALLRYAAVLGATFSADLVGDVLADDAQASADSEAWDRLTEFVERDPYTPGAFRFRHALFRDAAYEGLSFRRRGELHAKVGRAYERLEEERPRRVRGAPLAALLARGRRGEDVPLFARGRRARPGQVRQRRGSRVLPARARGRAAARARRRSRSRRSGSRSVT